MINDTTKEFSNQESTNPTNGLLDLLEKGLIVESNISIINPQIENNLIIINK